MPLSQAPVPRFATTVASAVAAPQIRNADQSILVLASFQLTRFMPGRDMIKMPPHAVMYISIPVCLGMNHSTTMIAKTIVNFSSSPLSGPTFLRSSFRESRPFTMSISGLYSQQRMSHASTMLTNATGTPTRDH